MRFIVEVPIFSKLNSEGREGTEAVHDEMVIYEVMAQELDLTFNVRPGLRPLPYRFYHHR
jgi:hypothetical protein